MLRSLGTVVQPYGTGQHLELGARQSVDRGVPLNAFGAKLASGREPGKLAYLYYALWRTLCMSTGL